MITARRLGLTALVGVAVALLVVGFQATKPDSARACAFTPLQLRAVYPPCGDLDLRQSRIGFQLDPAFTGRLLVDGRAVPDDQVQKIVGLNQFFFTPGPGTETGALRPGAHSATATYWRIGTDESTAKSFTWTFSSH